MSEESWEDIVDEICQEMAGHVSHKVGREDGAKRKGDDDVGPSTRPVGGSKDRQGIAAAR
jgi:hypothetical protein